jgi:hypothetical protein
MNLNRDEFLLLSRTGRSTYSTRAGPGPGPGADERFEAGLTGRWFRRRSRSGLTLQRGDGRGLRHVLGPRSGRSTRVSRTLGYADETYFEMEFAVGFPAEEETPR